MDVAPASLLFRRRQADAFFPVRFQRLKRSGHAIYRNSLQLTCCAVRFNEREQVFLLRMRPNCRHSFPQGGVERIRQSNRHRGHAEIMPLLFRSGNKGSTSLNPQSFNPGIVKEIAVRSAASVVACSAVSSTSGGRTFAHAGSFA
jgi:hypothetical protein